MGDNYPAIYYLESPVWLAMTQNENFKSITVDELLQSEHGQYLRDDSDIKDDDDFLITLIYLTHWSVERIPKIIYDYIDKNLFTNFKFEEYYDNISTEYIEDIYNYIKNKFGDENKTIACNLYHSFGLKEDHTITMWGEFDWSIENLIPLPKDKLVKFACGYNHVVGIKEDGTIIAWGDNYYGQIDAPESEKFIQVVCSMHHSIALRDDGTIFIWGGDIHFSLNELPEGKFIQVACGYEFSIGLRENGTITGWGRNKNNQLKFLLDKNIMNIKFIKIISHSYHTVALSENGSVFDFNNELLNEYDYDGSLITEKRNEIMWLPAPEGKFIKIACGKRHSVAIDINGYVFTWGNNNHDQLYDSPKGKFIKIACGKHHSVGIREDGTVVTWGDNIFHQRDGSPEGKFIEIACGKYHSIGLREDGTVATWGNNDWKQLDNLPLEKMLT